MSKPVAIWDLDDTLTGCVFGDSSEVRLMHEVYKWVIDRFADRMVELGFERQEALDRHETIDCALCQIYGFDDLGRFPRSLASAYESLMEDMEKDASEEEMAALENLGYEVFTEVSYAPLPGARHVLEAASQSFFIAVVTRGQKKEQTKKMVDAGIMRYVDKYYTVGHKNEQEWSEILSDLRIASDGAYSPHWAIGNSVKQDINMPLAFGLNAIHVNVTKWSFEEAPYITPKSGRRVHTVASIGDVLRYLPFR